MRLVVNAHLEELIKSHSELRKKNRNFVLAGQCIWGSFVNTHLKVPPLAIFYINFFKQ